MVEESKRGEEGARYRKLTPPIARIIYWLGVFYALFHLYVLGVSPIDPWAQRAIHLVMIVSLLFSLIPARSNSPLNRPSIVDLSVIVLMIGGLIYLYFNFDDLIFRMGVLPEPTDVIFSTVVCLVVLEMVRRLNGWVLPAIALFFICYAMFGSALPGLLGHKGYSFDRTISFVSSLGGIYGPALAAAATFVTLFVIFGSFLNASGAAQFFVDLSFATAGSRRGGPAKVAVLSSALFGSISGSAVSNVVTTGSITIPMMKSIGYLPHFAGAVEAAASTGGQLMPPVMSATAFVMSEITGIPYLEIVYAAILPSVLYFVSVYFMVDNEARNLNLVGLPRSELPRLFDVFRRDGHLLIPLIVLIYALVILMTSPLRAALMSIVALIAVSFLRPKSRMWPKRIADALNRAMINMLDITSVCALAGVIVGVFALTGLGLKFATALIALSGGHLWLALVLTMIVCIILGMGMPTVPAYVITAAAVAPALEKMGVPTISAHLFILYFAAISTITPPVAITAFAAAGLAKADPVKTAVAAVKLGIAAYIVPFMFIYNSTLLLRGGLLAISLTVPTALLGVWALAKALQDRSMNYFFRGASLIAAFVLIKPGLYTDLVGIGLVIIIIIWQWKARRPKSRSRVVKYRTL